MRAVRSSQAAQQDCMEITVADVAQNRALQDAVCDVGLGFRDCFGKARDRNADVSGDSRRTLL